MHHGANERQITPCVIVWSRRQLLVDCLAHHFTDSEPTFRVVSSSTEELDGSIPTVCIRDVGRDRYSSIEKSRAVEEIRHAAPGARILIFSKTRAEQDAKDWIAAGAHGFFSTLSTPALLTAVVMLLAAGGLFLPEDVIRSMVKSPSHLINDGP